MLQSGVAGSCARNFPSMSSANSIVIGFGFARFVGVTTVNIAWKKEM